MFQLASASATERVLVGSFGFPRMSLPEGVAEFGLLISPDHHRKGLCALAHLVGLGFAFETLRVRSVLFRTLAANVPMRSFFDKHGFVLRDVGSDWDPTSHNYVLPWTQWPTVKASLQKQLRI
jgi:RimJ/RimL family protein N-acetyltransferase